MTPSPISTQPTVMTAAVDGSSNLIALQHGGATPASKSAPTRTVNLGDAPGLSAANNYVGIESRGADRSLTRTQVRLQAVLEGKGSKSKIVRIVAVGPLITRDGKTISERFKSTVVCDAKGLPITDPAKAETRVKQLLKYGGLSMKTSAQQATSETARDKRSAANDQLLATKAVMNGPFDAKGNLRVDLESRSYNAFGGVSLGNLSLRQGTAAVQIARANGVKVHIYREESPVPGRLGTPHAVCSVPNTEAGGNLWARMNAQEPQSGGPQRSLRIPPGANAAFKKGYKTESDAIFLKSTAANFGTAVIGAIGRGGRPPSGPTIRPPSDLPGPTINLVRNSKGVFVQDPPPKK